MKREYRMIRRLDWSAPRAVRLVAKAEGYAMVRRKGCIPFVIPAEAWDSAPPLADAEAA